MVFNCFSLSLEAEIRSVEGVGDWVSVRYKGVIFLSLSGEKRYKEVLIDYCFKFERASFRSSGGRGVDGLLVVGNRDALV